MSKDIKKKGGDSFLRLKTAGNDNDEKLAKDCIWHKQHFEDLHFKKMLRQNFEWSNKDKATRNLEIRKNLEASNLTQGKIPTEIKYENSMLPLHEFKNPNIPSAGLKPSVAQELE